MDLTDTVSKIPGVGPKYQSLLNKIGIYDVEDLLLHIPYKYEDRSKVQSIDSLVHGERVSVICTIDKIKNVYTKFGKKLTTARVSDPTGKLDVIWFNQQFLTQSFSGGDQVVLFGALNPNQDKPQMISPDIASYSSGETLRGLIPLYPLTAGITNKYMSKIVKVALEDTLIEEILPLEITKSEDLCNRLFAIKSIHMPDSFEDAARAKYRLAFEELILLHLKGMKLRSEWNKKVNSHQIHLDTKLRDEFTSSLAFQLTAAQIRVVSEILDDLDESIPMNRLVQGDVGSGKTVVTSFALLAAAKSGFNSLYMAPTQVLAEQHRVTLSKLLQPYDVKVGLVTGTRKEFEDNDVPNVVVGTHAIIHNLEKFSNIGLVVIDEQQKFGVAQRTEIVEYFTKKGEIVSTVPNLLTTTATPIPRSLALTLYGDLDLSVIDELPKGRKRIETWVINEQKRKSCYEWIQNRIIEDNIQVFYVCPFIEQSEAENLQNVKAAEDEYKILQDVFPNLRLGLLHGRMPVELKREMIADFQSHKLDILVTTPVIEVGVDIPNANIIFIETAERFGLASLHQLRGRVGRDNKQAYCVLMPSTRTQSAVSRLKNLEHVYSGVELSEIDLGLRGPGNMYGTEQHGFMNLKIADITDFKMLKETKLVAANIFSEMKDFDQLATRVSKFGYIEDN